MAAPSKVDPYRFDASLERVAALYSCVRQSFWGRVGRLLDPEAVASEHAKLVLTACRQILLETGNGPVSDRQVVQRLRSMRQDGKVSREQIDAAEDYLDRASEETIAWPEEAAVDAIAMVLKPRLEQQALVEGFNEWSAKGDLLPIAEKIVEASRVGAADMTLGTVWGADAVVPAFTENALATGIDPLDDALGGGVYRGELCVVAGDTGAGKSLFLTQVTAEGAIQQKLGAYITLEVGVNVIGRRLAANMTGIPYDSIKRGEALTQVQEIIRKKKFVQPVVKAMAADATTVSDILGWLKYSEAALKRPFDLLVIDMADHLTSPRSKENDYKGMKTIYAALRELAIDRDMWLWTASHTKDRKDKNKSPKAGDLADSRNKGRIADTLVTLNYHEETKDVDVYLAKGRDIEGQKLVCTRPTNYACSMIVSVTRVGVGED